MAEDKKRSFIKITFQDLEIAEKFFENEKHFNEFIVAVISYYRGKNVNIKSKIVQKYFETYKKTMDFIMQSVDSGYKGQVKLAENKQNNNDTLKGVVEVPLTGTLPPNNKDKSNNINEQVDYSILDSMLNSEIWITDTSKFLHSRSIENTKRLVKEFWNEKLLTGKLDGRTEKQVKEHFINTMKLKPLHEINKVLGGLPQGTI